jgi:cytochrome c biogenesis factor
MIKMSRAVSVNFIFRRRWGRGLSLAQDPGLAFHPPFLYFGYVGFSITYSFAIDRTSDGSVSAACR